MTVRAILTDIEGTTSSIRFVKDVLFPFAAEHLPRFIAEAGSRPDVKAMLEETRQLAGQPDADDEAVTEILLGWIAEDRKATPLKALQGLIWEEGYRAGQLKGDVYPDALEALKAWKEAGLPLYVYSSGSVAAQKLLFGYTQAGDLTPLFSGYFDTTTGPKLEAESYRRIAEAIGVAPSDILFLSDNEAELDAAAAAGCQAIGLDRDGVPHSDRHRFVTSFSDIQVEA
ncbi:acireductone synthase [Telmatospirillum sp. J64-1]|uniref:acireductone synthase n=1 Tax=Telmatospirillum sp. J64-1 TaxID=2502183 RepID=UPI00115EFFDB|nr:acireductone synthase [Telmatospirillum sp. J64-1]